MVYVYICVWSKLVWVDVQVDAVCCGYFEFWIERGNNNGIPVLGINVILAKDVELSSSIQEWES